MPTVGKQECSKCNKMKPANRFNEASTQCRDCRTEYQREYRKNGAGSAARKPGRPPSTPVLPPMPVPDISLPSRRAAGMPAFDDRLSLEAYIKLEMANNLEQYDRIIDSAERMLAWSEQHNAMKEAIKQQGVIRSTLKDKQSMIAGLTKQFELLANLDKPMSEDPKFTPVKLVLALDPPPRAFVDKPHYLDPEDIQDGQDIS